MKLSHLAGAIWKAVRSRKPPPVLTPGGYPEGWTKTLDEVSADPKLQSADAFQWARAYETDLLRKTGVRFPVNGDIYEAVRDLKVTYLTHWKAPYSHGGEGILPAGTRVRADVHPDIPEPIAISASPVEYERIEALLVPEIDRKGAKYDGYSISVKTVDLNRDYRLIAPPGM